MPAWQAMQNTGGRPRRGIPCPGTQGEQEEEEEDKREEKEMRRAMGNRVRRAASSREPFLSLLLSLAPRSFYLWVTRRPPLPLVSVAASLLWIECHFSAVESPEMLPLARAILDRTAPVLAAAPQPNRRERRGGDWKVGRGTERKRARDREGKGTGRERERESEKERERE